MNECPSPWLSHVHQKVTILSLLGKLHSIYCSNKIEVNFLWVKFMYRIESIKKYQNPAYDESTGQNLIQWKRFFVKSNKSLIVNTSDQLAVVIISPQVACRDLTIRANLNFLFWEYHIWPFISGNIPLGWLFK